MLLAMRIAAIAGAAAGLAAFGYFSPSFRPQEQLLVIWVLAPLSLGYFVAIRVAHHQSSAWVALTGLLLAGLCAFWLYGIAVYGQLSGNESLSGLMVLFAPLYQFAILVVFLPAAFIVDRLAVRHQWKADSSQTGLR
ncbi:MAG TPA: hypothetical protein VEH78_06490 [Pseudolabrys sp.]|nr:hypothetical protein [Pseudolabrys sp.]